MTFAFCFTPFKYNSAPLGVDVTLIFISLFGKSSTVGRGSGLSTLGAGTPPGRFPPPIIPSLSVLPANANSLSLRLNESSLVNLPPPNSPESLGPD